MHAAFLSLSERYRDLLDQHSELSPQAPSSDPSQNPHAKPRRSLSTAFSFKYVPKVGLGQADTDGGDLGDASSARGSPPSAEDILKDLEALVERMIQAGKLSQTQASLVHVHNYSQTLVRTMPWLRSRPACCSA